jgi:hypothetical protein
MASVVYAIAVAVVNAGAVAYAWASANIMLAAVAALSLDAALRKPKNPNFSNDTDLRRESVLRSAIEPRNILYGKTLAGGVLSYMNVSGDENADMWIVVSHAGHEAHDIIDLYMYDEFIGASVIGWDSQVSGGKYRIGGTSYLSAYKQLGGSTQTVMGALESAFPDVTNEHRGRGVAYSAIKLTLETESEKVFEAGAPQGFRALGEWKNDIYDPRLDSTPGADPSNASYQVYTTNPILIAANYLTDQKLGMRISTSRVIWASIAAGADYCDVMVPTHTSGAYEKRFTANGMLTTADQHKDNLLSILSSCNGRFGYRNGKVFIAPGRLGSGYNLAANPKFVANVSGWILGVNGAVQSISTTAGRTYTAKVNVKGGDSGAYQLAVSSNADGSSPSFADAGTTTDSTLYVTWLATGTSYICLNSTADTAASITFDTDRLVVTDDAGTTAEFDDVEVYLVSQVSADESWLRGDVTLQTATPKGERFNTARGFYVSRDDKYKKVEALSVTNTAFIARDNGETLFESFNLGFTDHEDEAQRILHKRIQQTDNQKIVRLPCNFKALKVAVHDHITLTISELGWSNKVFRVLSWRLAGGGEGIDLVLKEDSAAGYEDPDQADYSSRTASGGVTVATPEVPAATSVGLTAVEGGNLISWVAPRISTYFDTIDVYANAADSFGTATLISSVRGTSFLHKLDSGENRFYWVQARKAGEVSAEVATSPTNATAANALAAAALTAHWSSIVDDDSFKPDANATVGAVAGTNLTSASGAVLGDADVLNSVVVEDLTQIRIASTGEILEIRGGGPVQLATPGHVAKYAFEADQVLGGYINNLNASFANLTSALGDITAGVADVYIQATAPVPGVSGVPDPIIAGSRWYDIDDDFEPHYYTGGAWVSLADPRIASNAAEILLVSARLNTTAATVLGHANDINLNAQGLSTTDATVLALGNLVGVLAGEYNAFEAAYVAADLEAATAANSQAITATNARVDGTEDAITASSSDITSLSASNQRHNIVETTQGEPIELRSGGVLQLQPARAVASSASTAVNLLDSLVRESGELVTAQSSRILTLTASLESTTAALAGAVNALNSLQIIVELQGNIITSSALEIDALEVGILDEQNARATAISSVDLRASNAEGVSSSIAHSLNSIGTVVGDHSSSITQQALSIDGIEAQWTLVIDNNGHVAGIRLLSGEGGVATFVIDANAQINGDLVTTGTISAQRLSLNGSYLSVNDQGQLTIDRAPNTELTRASESTNGAPASVVIERVAGGVTTVQVSLVLIESLPAVAADPFPVTLTLHRDGVLVATYAGIRGEYEQGVPGAEPSFASANFGATFYDSDAGTGDTTYTLSQSSTAFATTLQIISKSTIP